MSYDPEKDPNVIVLQKQEDGNWKGWMQKNGKIIEERQINPQYTFVRVVAIIVALLIVLHFFGLVGGNVTL